MLHGLLFLLLACIISTAGQKGKCTKKKIELGYMHYRGSIEFSELVTPNERCSYSFHAADRCAEIDAKVCGLEVSACARRARKPYVDVDVEWTVHVHRRPNAPCRPLLNVSGLIACCGYVAPH